MGCPKTLVSLPSSWLRTPWKLALVVHSVVPCLSPRLPITNANIEQMMKEEFFWSDVAWNVHRIFLFKCWQDDYENLTFLSMEQKCWSHVRMISAPDQLFTKTHCVEPKWASLLWPVKSSNEASPSHCHCQSVPSIGSCLMSWLHTAHIAPKYCTQPIIEVQYDLQGFCAILLDTTSQVPWPPLFGQKIWRANHTLLIVEYCTC